MRQPSTRKKLLYKNLNPKTMNSKFLLIMMLVFAIPEVVSGQNVVTGKVLDEASSQCLPGVNVMIKGTTHGTYTDANGGFSIQAPTDAVLLFSFIGYAPQEV